MKLLTNKQQKSNKNAKICYICKEKCEDKHKVKIKNILKLGSIVITRGNVEVLHIGHVI